MTRAARGLPLFAGTDALGFLQRLWLPGLQTVHLSKVSFTALPPIGDSCWHSIVGSHVLWTKTMSKNYKIHPQLQFYSLGLLSVSWDIFLQIVNA